MAVCTQDWKLEISRALLSSAPAWLLNLLERHVGLPDLPDFAYESWAGLESRLAGLPSRGCCFSGGAHMLEGLDLPDKFRHVSSNGRGEYFDGLYDSIRINDEAAPYIHAGFFIVYTVDSPYPPAGV